MSSKLQYLISAIWVMQLFCLIISVIETGNIMLSWFTLYEKVMFVLMPIALSYWEKAEIRWNK